MEVYILQQNEDTPIVVDDFISLRWRRKYYDIGEFELHLVNNRKNLEYVTRELEPLVYFVGSVERGVVNYVQVNRDEIVLSGRMESGVMKKCVIQGMTGSNIEDQLGLLWWKWDPINRDYYILCEQGTESSLVEYFYETQEELIVKLAKSNNIGFYVIGNDMYIYRGVDRSVSQNTVAPVVFDNDDLDSPIWEISTENYYDLAIAVGRDTNDNPVEVRVGDGDRQIFVDCQSTRQDENQTASEYEAVLKQLGYMQLGKHKLTDSFEASVSPSARWTYGQDYTLGDIVTLQMREWGKSESFRVTEVEEVWENGIYSVYPTFGDPLPETL